MQQQHLQEGGGKNTFSLFIEFIFSMHIAIAVATSQYGSCAETQVMKAMIQNYHRFKEPYSLRIVWVGTDL